MTDTQNTQEWLNKNYPDKKAVEKIELEEGILIAGQLHIEGFPTFRKNKSKRKSRPVGKVDRINSKKMS